MGGDLRSAPGGASPSFLVAALKDPIGGNIDRIQIVKGWLGADGELEERVFDVAVSDGETIGPDGRCQAPVGNTVDVANATWTNSIGDTELIAVWEDPDFDADHQSLLLRARVGDPDAALDRLRGRVLRHRVSRRGPDDDAGEGVYVADLVHALAWKALSRADRLSPRDW